MSSARHGGVDLSVVIPSRTQPKQAAFLAQALRSIEAQTARASLLLEVLIGLDEGAPTPEITDTNVRFIEASAKSQVAALNAALCESRGAIIAILEDDDRWSPNYLDLMLDLAQHAPLVTTNEIEVDETGAGSHISDCATPSAWVFHRQLWDEIGPFDDTHRFHFDCDWLGRVRESRAARVHVVEAGAPLESEVIARDRPFLAEILRQNAPGIRLARHDATHPLVARMRHPGAGMSIIASEAGPKAQSESEVQRLIARYGAIPR